MVDSPSSSLLATDSSGSVLRQRSTNKEHTFAYSPFGYDPLRNSLLSTLGYNAQPRDATGNYLLGRGYRAYNPALMIFISPDIYSPFGKGGLNSYAYCNRDPINLVDPDGEAGARPFTFTIDLQPEIQSRTFRPRPVVPAVPRQPQALAADPIRAPAQVAQAVLRPPLAAALQQQTPSLRRVRNNLAELVAAPENLRPPPRSTSLLSRIDSALHRASRFISSVFHPRRPAVTTRAWEQRYSAQQMHQSSRAFREAQARNTNFPVADAGQNLRREN
ncbi:RHS repeat-associated core domain-containing protein [Pseudomonas fakonensis]|nr:RHS repeat-associated core domain-containing protein [Pseudomonas fakonensis]